MPATYNDAKLIVALMRWGTEMGFDDALQEIFSDSFDSEDGSAESAAARKVLNFGETAGSFVKHGVLDPNLLTDLLGFGAMWRKVSGRALFMRDQMGEPRLYEHFEALAAKSTS